MTTQDKLTVEPNPIPMVEQSFVSPNIDDEDQMVYSGAAELDADKFTFQPINSTALVMHVITPFTQSEIQSLRSMLKGRLHELNDQIAEFSQLQKFFYSKSDITQKDRPSVQNAFDCLNQCRETLRDLKCTLRKNETIQRKLRVALNGA